MRSNTVIRQSARRLSPNFQASGARRILNARPDIPDIRDRIYEPALLDLDVTVMPPPEADSPILDQGREGACTGFALAAALNLLKRRRNRRLPKPLPPPAVSARMLYEMAKQHDEWPGENYDGSSVRGVIKGFFHNGVCDETLAPWNPGQKNWSLTVEQAKNARITGLGAYYRLRREILDYHAALNEVGVIVASAQVHRGWIDPGKGFIRKSNQHEGGHAFVIVGYDAEGFLVQNSWGRNWGSFNGRPGIAHWSYSDWAENTRDAWVLRLGVPTPEAFDLTHLVERKTSAGATTAVELREPRRQDIVGHFVHLDDGKLVETGRYATPLDTLRETGRWIKDDENRPSPKYDHLLFYAHGGLNSAADSARMIAATKEGFKRNRIYPVFFMWETGLFESLKDVLAGLFGRGVERIGGASDISDAILEKLARPTGRSIWRDIKSDAAKAFRKNAGGASAIAEIVGANLDRKAPLQMHVAGHSAGAVFLGELLKTWTVPTPIASAALMAPACTVGFYKNAFLPALSGAKPMLGRIEQYNLIDAREIADNVAIFYRKSLLYLVSRALEEHDEEPLLGLERHSSTLPLPARHIVRYAGRDRPQTDSPNHSGFDNDVATMNSLLALILGVKPKPSLAFKANELDFG